MLVRAAYRHSASGGVASRWCRRLVVPSQQQQRCLSVANGGKGGGGHHPLTIPDGEDPASALLHDMDTIEAFDDSIMYAGSTGLDSLGGGEQESSEAGGNNERGPGQPRKTTRRYILEDYRKAFQAVPPPPRSDKDSVFEPQKYGDDTKLPSVFIDDSMHRLDNDGFDVESAKDAMTPDEWFSTFGSNEENSWVFRHITSSRVSNMTAKGKTPSLKTLVVIGNRNVSLSFVCAFSSSDSSDSSDSSGILLVYSSRITHWSVGTRVRLAGGGASQPRGVPSVNG